MGIERPGTNPAEQGSAGFLTQEQLDEMNEATASATEVVPAAAAETATVEAPIGNSIDSGASPAGEQAPAAPLSPERKAEIMEQIGREEELLKSNLTESGSVLDAAEAKLNDPSIAASESRSRNLLTHAKIGEAYKKATSKINNLGMGAATAVAAASLGPAAYAGIHAVQLKDAGSLFGPDNWNHIATNFVQGGIGAGVAVAGVWAISRAMNWMKKKTAERKADNVYRAQTA